MVEVTPHWTRHLALASPTSLLITSPISQPMPGDLHVCTFLFLYLLASAKKRHQQQMARKER
jgi:hypothetical protein